MDWAYLRAVGSLALTVLLVGCSSHPLTPTGGPGLGLAGRKGGSGTAGAGGTAGSIPSSGDGGSAGPSGAAAAPGGPSGAAASPGGPSGTGGSPGDASMPDPWSYRGQPVTKVDVTRCAPYYGCDVCTLTLAGSAEPVVPNLDYTLPNPSCWPPPAGDAGADASSSPGGDQGPTILPFCALAGPDGGASGTITEIVLQPNGNAPPNPDGIPNAYCQLRPGPTIALPHGCLLLTLEDDFCVPDCSACP
jgi:hypothetical protein